MTDMYLLRSLLLHKPLGTRDEFVRLFFKLTLLGFALYLLCPALWAVIYRVIPSSHYDYHPPLFVFFPVFVLMLEIAKLAEHNVFGIGKYKMCSSEGGLVLLSTFVIAFIWSVFFMIANSYLYFGSMFFKDKTIKQIKTLAVPGIGAILLLVILQPPFFYTAYKFEQELKYHHTESHAGVGRIVLSSVAMLGTFALAYAAYRILSIPSTGVTNVWQFSSMLLYLNFYIAIGLIFIFFPYVGWLETP